MELKKRGGSCIPVHLHTSDEESCKDRADKENSYRKSCFDICYRCSCSNPLCLDSDVLTSGASCHTMWLHKQSRFGPSMIRPSGRSECAQCDASPDEVADKRRNAIYLPAAVSNCFLFLLFFYFKDQLVAVF